jgi:hypothetical protein
MPLFPARRASQFTAVPTPRGDTKPTPVTATRLGSLFTGCLFDFVWTVRGGGAA